MKIFDPKRHLPVGWDWENLRNNLLWGHSLTLVSLFAFLTGYFDARESLYSHTQDLTGRLIRELILGRTITPFRELMGGFPLLVPACFLLAMAVQVWRHYSWHTRDSMAIYTMRRLPDRWELHRRCWTQPLLSSLAELLLFGLLTFFCWLLWRFATPAVCLPH